MEKVLKKKVRHIVLTKKQEISIIKPNNRSSKVNFTATPGEYSFQVKASDKYDNSTETITVKILPETNEAPELEIQCPI